MIRWAVLCFLFSALSTASFCQTLGARGAWRQTPLKWTKPPAELQLKQRLAEAALVYFGPDHGFVMVYGTVIQGPQSEGLSRGDGQVVYLGSWSQHGDGFSVEYRLVSRTVRKEGEPLPGPVRKAKAIVRDRTLLFGGLRFHRDLRLDSDLRDVEKGESARLKK